MSSQHIDPIDRSLDILMVITGLGVLGLLAYDLNVAALGRRLVREVTEWVREQTAPAATGGDES